MLRLYAGVFVVVIRDLAGATAQLSMMCVDGDADLRLAELGDLRESLFAKPLREVETEISKLPISSVLRGKIPRLIDRVSTDEVWTVATAEALFKELTDHIIAELTQSSFLVIPPGRRAMYVQREPQFGPKVANRFGDGNDDIAAAARCVALEEWTAAVFHLMRVVEHGLHALAAKMQIPMSATIEIEQWHNIIDQIEAEIRRLDQTLPRGPAKSETLQFYSEVASNFRYFKDAWRNHVSHSRKTYDERAALAVWDHVSTFMQELAEHLQ